MVFDKSKYKCFIRHKNDHLKKNCLERGIKVKYVQIMVASDEDDYESDGALVITSLKMENIWIMDSWFSYHMYPKIEYFETLELKEKEGGFVRLNMFENHEFLLHGGMLPNFRGILCL